MTPDEWAHEKFLSDQHRMASSIRKMWEGWRAWPHSSSARPQYQDYMDLRRLFLGLKQEVERIEREREAA